MANFDPNDYFQRRAGNVIADKQASLQQTAVNKYAEIDASVAAAKARFTQNSNSWVGKLGLDSDSFAGEVVNMAASAVSGVSRLAGQVAELPVDVMTATIEAQIGEDAIQAYNRQLRGEASQQDISYLNSKKLGDTFTPLQLIQQAKDSRSLSRGVANTFDLKNIVNQDKRDVLSADLGAEFDSSWGKTKQGWDKLQQSGNRLSGVADIATGLGGLVSNAGEAAVSNPAAAAEHIIENLPQLAVGAYGKAGKAILGASNAGYGSELYQQGVETYQKANGGQLPPEALRREMAMNAVRASLMEQASDTVMLGVSKLGKGATEAATRTGFKESLKNIGKATGSGLLSEAPTEGIQTYLEGEATLKPASAKDIYIGATIGGIAGSGMTGGGRALAEVAQATPEHVAKKEADKATTDSFVENAKTGNIDTYLDPKSKEFDPAKGIATLFANSQLADTTPEAKQKNSDKANSIVAGLVDERKQAQLELESLTPAGLKKTIADLEAKLPNLSEKGVAIAQDMLKGYKEDLANFDSSKIDPKAVKHLTDQVIKLDRQIAESTKIKDQLLVQNTPKEADVTLAVEKVNAPIDTTSEESQGASTQAADHVISMAMSHPGSFTDDHLKNLVENTQNALTTPQRSYLRSMSEARIAENAMKNIPLVGKEIMDGDPAKNQLGIADYKQRMGAAVASGNESKADSALHMLTKFADGHQQKLDTLRGVFSSVGTGAVNMVPTKSGWQAAESQDTSTAGRTANRKLGGLTISAKSTKLMTAITAETVALNAAKEQLKAAYALKFTSTPVVNSSPSVEAVERKEPPKPVQLTEDQTQSKVDSTVDSKKEPAVPVVAPVTDVQEAPVVNKKERKPSDPSLRDDLVGAIMRVTGGKGIETKTLEDATHDAVKNSGRARILASKTGIQDLGDIATLLLEEENYGDGTAETLADLLQKQVIHNVYTAERENSIAAKHKIKEENAAINQMANENGVKGLRGSRKLTHILADIAVLEAERSAWESEEERAAIRAADAIFEIPGIDPAGVMHGLSETVGYTEKEINDVESNTRTDASIEGSTNEAANGKAETNIGERTQNGNSEKGTESKSGKLQALKEVVDLAGKKFGEAYSSINLLAHNLIQKTSKAGKTQRPLVAVHGFLSAWIAGNVDLQEFAGKETLLDPQKDFLDHFKVMAEKWLPIITKNFKKPVSSDEHRDIQPLQYLINSEKREGYDYNITPENLKTAIALAAFSYVAENAKAPRTSTEEKIKRFFGLAEYDYISPKLVDALYELGTPEKAIAISLGQRAVQALGISAKTGATKDSLARLEADLGAHVLKLLVDQNILQRSYVSAATLREGLGKTEEAGKKQGSMYFLQMNQNNVIESISSKAVGTQGALATVFGVESQLTMPSWTPISVTQTTTDNTDQEVPDFLKAIVKHENGVANYVREDMWKLLNNLDDETFLRMAGYVDPDPTTMHHTEIKALKAKNEGLRRELEVFKEYVTTMSNSVENGGSPEGIKQALYLAHSVWKQQRVGIDGVIDPQSSKIHRWLLTRASWLTEVSSTDTDNFFLRVAEGLGVKTDKQSNDTSLKVATDLFNEKSTDPKTAEKAKIIMDAVRALVATNIERAIVTPALAASIQKGVKAGSGNMHSLDSLVAMAAYEHAKTAATTPEGVVGEFTFKVQLMGEVDGVTNGPMLSHLMMGAGANATALFQRLNKGGFFQDASGYMNYNVWRGDSTHKDLYEETISKVLETLTALGTTSADVDAVMKSLWAVTGKLDDKGAITKDGRNIIKQPLTAMLFGSTLNNAVDGMLGEFLEKAYAGFGSIAKMDASEQKAALEAYVAHLNTLIGTVDDRIPMHSLEHFLTKFEFSIEQEKRIGDAFKGSLGEAVKQTMKSEFKDFLYIRKVLNNTANTSFGLYNAAYQGVRQSVIAELIASGDLAYRDKKNGSKETRHDLTTEQEALIDARVAKLIPVVHTYMSKQSENGSTSGLLMAKTAREFSKEHAYSVISKFAKALPPVEWSSGQWNSGAFSMTSAAYQRTQETPGVGMVVMMMHSLDSAISHIAAMGREVLNVHDAHGSGLAGFIETAKALNAATWKVAVGYSPATELRDSFVNTLKGMDEMLRTGKDKEAVIAELKKFYAELSDSRGEFVYGEKIPADQRTLLTSEVRNIFGTAYQSDKTKYEALLQMLHIDQYALEGGQYDVTPEDRAEVQKLLDAMGTNHIPGSIWAMVDRINLAVLGTDVMNQPAKTDFGGLGQSTIQSDQKLVTFFEDKNIRTAKEVIDQLKGSLNTQNREILKKIIPLINMDMPIQMITQSTKATDTISKLENARGWFSRKGTSDYIYVLSPEYSASGLTPEMLLHELLHAALSRTIAKPKTPEAKALMVSLNTLKDAVVAHLEANPELKAKYSFEMTIDELVSWGMSDREFQQEVLEVIPMNRNISLMEAFIRAISKFFKLTVMQDGIKVSNGMASLLHDVSGLFNETLKAKEGKKQSGDNDVQTYAMASIDRLSTTDVYEALNEGKVTPTFDEHLRSLLDGIVTQLHGPYGSFKSLVASNTVKTPTALWNKAKRDGIAPFASASLASGIQINDQVAFVLEQVEVTVQAALDNTTGRNYDVAVEMSKLYQEASTTFNEDGRDFHTGDWSVTTPAEQQRAKATYDFLFKTNGSLGTKADHLARFAALGLAHPEINAALSNMTSRESVKAGGSIAVRLERLFQKVLSWFNGKLTHTHDGQQANEKLTALVNQLLNIELARKAPMKESNAAVVFINESIKKATETVKQGASKVGQSSIVQNSSSAILRASGKMLSAVAGERTDQIVEMMQKVRDSQLTQGHGMAMSMLNEVRGINKGNEEFHRLIRESKMREGTREDLILTTSNVSLTSFANKGKDLTPQDKHAITAVFLRTGMADLLDHFTMAEITNLVGNKNSLDAAIKRLETQVDSFAKVNEAYKTQAKILAYKLAEGKVRGHHLMMNAHNIARMSGTGLESMVTEAQAKAATPIVDQLVSLYALQYTGSVHRAAAKKIMAIENARGNESGIEMVLKLQKTFQEDSKEKLFSGSEALMMKGYTPEIYDPRKEVLVATEAEGISLMAQGYAKGLQVSYDQTDPDRNTVRHVYKRSGGGLRPWLSTIFSYTGESSKGSRSKTDNVKDLSEWKANQQDLTKMNRDKASLMRGLLRPNPNFDPSKVTENFAAPIMNAKGQVTDYRYLMSENNKDALLNRDNSFDRVLGVFAGSIFDKVSTKESNRKSVQALYDQYQADFATRAESYRTVGMLSTDTELRDIFRMLPDDTKQAIKEIWGTEHMMVRSDLMDINFGYRKVSMTDAFRKEKKGVVDTLFVGLMQHVMGEKAEYNVRRAEDVWQEIVGEVKDILVIKNLSTLIGNISSNVSLLFWQGVPLSDMVRYHRIAIKGMANYRRDSAALGELETQLKAGYITTTKHQMQQEIARLQETLARNPVKELIDAGLMPSIVEDVSPEDDRYSYKSEFNEYVDDHTNKWNKQVIAGAKEIYMAKNTKAYQVLHHVTQLSDFVARYALYQHVTTRKDAPMSKTEAIQLASDSFINYDLPSHRKLQYLNDMGLTPFTKYYLRIQRVIGHLYAEHPMRAMGVLVFNHYMDAVPVLTDSGFSHKLGNNPFSSGAFAYPGVLDELGTIKLLASPFK